MIKFLEKTWGPISFLSTTAWAVLDFLRPLGNYIYILAAVLLVLTILSVLCSKNNALLQKIKNLTAFAPDFIKNELIELWQPDGVVFWKKGLFQVLAFLTTLSIAAAAYGEDNKQGLLSTNFETVASLQSSLGVISNKLDVISKKQEEMKVAIDLVKKETSEDPRKELANLGVAWKNSEFKDSIKREDFKSVKLFLSGGMPWELSYITKPLEKGNLKIINLLIEHKDKLERVTYDCARLMDKFVRLENANSNLAHNLTRDEKLVLKVFCSSTENIKYAEAQYLSSEEDNQEQLADYKQRLLDIVPHKECVDVLMKNDSRALIDEAIKFGNTAKLTFNSRDKLLNSINNMLMLGGIDQSKLHDGINSYCVESNKVPDLNIIDWVTVSKKQILDTIKS